MMGPKALQLRPSESFMQMTRITCIARDLTPQYFLAQLRLPAYRASLLPMSHL